MKASADGGGPDRPAPNPPDARRRSGPPPAGAPAVPPPLQSRRHIRPHGRPEPTITIPSPPPAAPSGLDRRTEEKLKKGRRAPDARIDLHGMTAARAHGALSAFVARSRGAGHRCVLVITGKGGASGPNAPGQRLTGGPAPGAPGVLRREVPVWLATPPLAAMIVHVAPAHPRHGGAGALYVYLKRRRAEG